MAWGNRSAYISLTSCYPCDFDALVLEKISQSCIQETSSPLVTVINFIECDALRDLVPFVQLKNLKTSMKGCYF